MYFNLALKNVKKSFKDFMIYFLTLSFSVCLFYTFNSFQAQQAVLTMNQSQSEIIGLLSEMMTLLSFFVTIVLTFLILYANNFLIKRRKKELGLYTLLGMPRKNISKILVYETFIIGLISLLSGMLAGLLLSQVTTAMTASLFRVPLNYHFVFSPLATIITLFAFGGIFFLSMLCNTFVLNRYKLIDLINAERRNDDIKLKKTWISIVVFILSILFLGYAYYTSTAEGEYSFQYLINICSAGVIGTFLFFLSLSGFLLSIINHSKSIYLKNLNCFVLRQIHSNINTNFVSMSFVCIMLLLSIGALSIGMSLNHTVNETIKNSSPYDYTYSQIVYYKVTNLKGDAVISRSEKYAHVPDQFEKLLKSLPIDAKYIRNQSYTTIYQADITYNNDVFVNALKEPYEKYTFQNSSVYVNVIPLSSFNEELRLRNYDTISLKKNETYMFSNYGMNEKTMKTLLKQKLTIPLYGSEKKVMNDTFHNIILGTSTYSYGSDLVALVVNDNEIPSDANISMINWNVNHTKDISDEEFSNMVKKKIYMINKTLPEGKYFQTEGVVSTRDAVYENNRGMSVMMTYIGIYLGTVFMLASAVILALQQLSQAADNKKRYRTLEKLGTSQTMINRSILIQISIYFLLPLALAVVHSYMGVRMMNGLIVSFGKSDIMMSSILTAGIITCVYGSYFLVTYMGYKNIIRGNS